jgi:hypothetical protein
MSWKDDLTVFGFGNRLRSREAVLDESSICPIIEAPLIGHPMAEPDQRNVRWAITFFGVTIVQEI